MHGERLKTGDRTDRRQRQARVKSIKGNRREGEREETRREGLIRFPRAHTEDKRYHLGGLCKAPETILVLFFLLLF